MLCHKRIPGSYAIGNDPAFWSPHATRDWSGERGTRGHFRLATQVSTVGNRSDSCGASRVTARFGSMRPAIDRPRDPAAAISYENLPLKARLTLPCAKRIGG